MSGGFQNDCFAFPREKICSNTTQGSVRKSLCLRDPPPTPLPPFLKEAEEFQAFLFKEISSGSDGLNTWFWVQMQCRCSPVCLTRTPSFTAFRVRFQPHCHKQAESCLPFTHSVYCERGPFLLVVHLISTLLLSSSG